MKHASLVKAWCLISEFIGQSVSGTDLTTSEEHESLQLEIQGIQEDHVYLALCLIDSDSNMLMRRSMGFVCSQKVSLLMNKSQWLECLPGIGISQVRNLLSIKSRLPCTLINLYRDSSESFWSELAHQALHERNPALYQSIFQRDFDTSIELESTPELFAVLTSVIAVVAEVWEELSEISLTEGNYA
ncbi:hypothetical protein LC593_34830 [Nostoc sp. CHAB 5844]|nr:hypothetical protein [Nostoc sp. CHAB 5844]